MIEYIKPNNVRAPKTNNALHLWFRHIAQYWAEIGYEKQMTIGTIEYPWSEESVKGFFKKLAKHQVHEYETKKLSDKQVSDISEAIIRHYAKEGQELPPFPSEENYD